MNLIIWSACTKTIGKINNNLIKARSFYCSALSNRLIDFKWY